MLTTLLTTAAVAASGLLPVPLPTPLPIPWSVPTDPATEPTPQVQPVELTGTLQAADGRLKRGCKDYQYAYSVTTASDDWSFDITMQDHNGKGVNAQSLIGPNDATSGVLAYRLCRWATEPGPFTLTGVLVSYDGEQETTVEVATSFRLRKRNR